MADVLRAGAAATADGNHAGLLPTPGLCGERSRVAKARPLPVAIAPSFATVGVNENGDIRNAADRFHQFQNVLRLGAI